MTNINMSEAMKDVCLERQRQVSQEGWTHEHDDKHADGSMADAAAAYALHKEGFKWRFEIINRIWPWHADWWKPKDRRRDLVRAGALIVAEIERLDRRAVSEKGDK